MKVQDAVETNLVTESGGSSGGQRRLPGGSGVVIFVQKPTGGKSRGVGR